MLIMKLYLVFINGIAQIRPYKTKHTVYGFSSEDIIEYSRLRERGTKFSLDNMTCINEIFDWLINEKGLVYTDSFGIDRLTDKGMSEANVYQRKAIISLGPSVMQLLTIGNVLG